MSATLNLISWHYIDTCFVQNSCNQGIHFWLRRGSVADILHTIMSSLCYALVLQWILLRFANYEYNEDPGSTTVLGEIESAPQNCTKPFLLHFTRIINCFFLPESLQSCLPRLIRTEMEKLILMNLLTWCYLVPIQCSKSGEHLQFTGIILN